MKKRAGKRRKEEEEGGRDNSLVLLVVVAVVYTDGIMGLCVPVFQYRSSRSQFPAFAPGGEGEKEP